MMEDEDDSFEDCRSSSGAESEDDEREERLKDMTDVKDVLNLWRKSFKNVDFNPVPIMNR